MTETTEAGLAPKQPSGIRTAAVMCIQLINMGVCAITPAIAVLTEYWGSNPLTAALPVTLVSTIVTLTTMLGIVISGALVNKVKPKILAIIASVLFTFFGVLPFFIYNSYIFLLVCRALCGIGIGMMNPLGNAIVLGCYAGDKKDSLLGYGTLMMNGGGMVLQTVAGVLAGVGVGGRYVFLAHLFGIIAIIFAFLLPDPDLYQGEAAQEAPEGVEEAPKEKAHLPGSVWIVAIIIFGFNVLNYPAMLNCSSVLLDIGVSESNASFIASMALNCYTIFGMIASAIFGKVFQKIPSLTMPLGFLCAALGIFLIIVPGNIACVCIGMALIGGGFCLVYPACFSWCNAVCDPSSYASGISVIQTLMNFGGFVATYWMLLLAALTGESVYSAGWAECIGCIAFAIIFLLYNPWKGKKAQEA